MHCVGDEQRRPNKNRTQPEKVFKRLNSLISAVQFAGVLIVASQILIAVPKTISSDFILPGDFALEFALDRRTQNCSLLRQQTYYGFPGLKLNISVATRDFYFADFIGDLRIAIFVYAVAVAVGVVNKLLFDVNFFELIISHYIVIHKDLLTAAEWALMALSYWYASGADETGLLLQDYLRQCGVRASSTLPFVSPLLAIYLTGAVALGAHVVTVMILLHNAVGAGREALAKDHGGDVEARVVEEAQRELEEHEGGDDDDDENDNPPVEISGGPTGKVDHR